MNKTVRTLHTLDVPLGGNRTLRACLELDESGAPERLHLLTGWNEGAEWRQDRTVTAGEGCTLPAAAIGPLRAALCALALDAEDRAA
jgi:hypothetical protein